MEVIKNRAKQPKIGSNMDIWLIWQLKHHQLYGVGFNVKRNNWETLQTLTRIHQEQKTFKQKQTLHHFTAPQKKHSKTQQPKNTFKQKQTSKQPKTPPPHPLPPKKTCIYFLSHLISSARADRPIPLKLEARIIDLEGCASTSLAVWTYKWDKQWGWSRKPLFLIWIRSIQSPNILYI